MSENKLRIMRASRGPLAACKRMLRRLLRRPQRPILSTHPFDLKHGTDTSGLLEPAQLRTGQASDAHITAYFGVPPSRFLHAIERWRTTPDTVEIGLCRFIDIGCGKGRAILLASCMPFRDVLGVELHPSLAATAQANLQRWREQHSTAQAACILRDDVSTAIPSMLNGAVLLYLYNPFKPPVLRKLLQAILSRHQVQPEQVDILYLYPEYEEVFQEFPQFRRLWHEPIALDAEDEGDGLSAATDPCSLFRLSPGSRL